MDTFIDSGLPDARSVSAELPRLRDPDVSARGMDAVEDARSRLAEFGWRLRIFPHDPADPWMDHKGVTVVRVSIQEPGFVWEERRRVRWPEPAGEFAYLKASFMSDDGIYRTASDPLTWKFNWEGWRASDDLADRWRRAHVHASVVPASFRRRGQRGRNWQSDYSPTPDEMASDLEALGGRFEEEWRIWVTRMRQPFVEFINVAPSRRRLGVATALYQAAAGYLGSLGLTLRASTLQRPEAAAAWEKLARLWGLSRMAVPTPFDDLETYVFDLRPNN